MNKPFITGPVIGDSRGEPRRPWERKATLSIGSQPPTMVRTCDISLSGMGIFSDEPILPGTVCAVSVTFPVGDRISTISITGQSVFCILVGQKGYRIGIQITDADTNTRRLIKQLLQLNS